MMGRGHQHGLRVQSYGTASRLPPPSYLIFTHIFGFCDFVGIFERGKTNSSNP